MTTPANVPFSDPRANFRPEFRFVLALCRANPVSKGSESEALLAEELNWDEVLRIGSVQRVLPLMWKQLLQGNLESNIPESIATAMRESAEDSARRNLHLTKVLLEIIAALRDVSVVALPFKGPALASRFYGNLGLRQSVDLDLLIRVHDLPTTLDVLARVGFSPEYPLTARQYKSMLDGGECEWSLFDADGLRLDLHWNVMARYFCVPVHIEPFWDRVVITNLAGKAIQDLAAEDLLISLALHARRHYWAKLIWICDIAQLLRQAPEVDLEHTLERCREMRSERAVLLTLDLCHQLFDTPLPPRVVRQIQAHCTLARLRTWCMRNLEIGLEADNSGLANYFYSLRCREYWRDRVGQVICHAFTPGLAEWQGTSTPPWLDLARHLVRMGTKASRFALGRES